MSLLVGADFPVTLLELGDLLALLIGQLYIRILTTNARTAALLFGSSLGRLRGK